MPTASCPPTSHSSRSRVPAQPAPHWLAGSCGRLHLRIRPTRNAFLLAPASPPDPGALRARGKLLLLISPCVTSGPNPRYRSGEAGGKGSEFRVAESSRSSAPGAGAIPRGGARTCSPASVRRPRLRPLAAPVFCGYAAAMPRYCAAICCKNRRGRNNNERKLSFYP